MVIEVYFGKLENDIDESSQLKLIFSLVYHFNYGFHEILREFRLHLWKAL